MTSVDPYSVDFASLRILKLVHAHQSFSKAADSLGANQSTISYAIARLREVFHDPLFVRQGGGIVATERCNEIVAETQRLSDEFSALIEPRVFDPAEARAEVRLSCNYYERVVLLPPLIRRLRKSAPYLRLNIISSTVEGRNQLSRGESDLLIGPIEINDAGFYRRRLLEDEYVCVMAPENPLAGQVFDLERYVNAPHAVVTYGGNWKSSYLGALETLGLSPNTVIEVPSPANLPSVLGGTDLIGTVPRRTAQAFGAAVVTVECPVPSPFGIDLYWTVRTHHSPMHRWFRAELASVAAQTASAA